MALGKMQRFADMTFAAQGRANGRHQVFTRHHLQDVSQRARRQAALHHDRVAMDRDEDDACRRVLAKDRGRGRDPVETRHRDVADDHVRRQALGGADHGRPSRTTATTSHSGCSSVRSSSAVSG